MYLNEKEKHLWIIYKVKLEKYKLYVINIFSAWWYT
jgi:hypothetical protein